VAAIYGSEATVLKGAAADRSAVVGALGGGSVIHIAAHAVSHAWVSDASYVALAGPAPSRLTAADVRALDLGPAEVVVLAACDTAAGGRPTLDSPLSLSRAFLAAGARAVVGSLWRVSDRATRVLSTRFHEEFVRTGDAALSLQRAQLALATSADQSLNAPRQWGAFVVLGG
jgi:CHAT domain-containing protein